ncbi:MAG: MBL fold metallo-hydrolase [Limnochordia bacterium]|jgi:ribonuclease BN (tRNA processing enzyme)
MALQVTFLGTASGLPTPDRFGQTVVVGATKADNDPPTYFLFDTGDGASSLLMRHGIDHLAVEAIFISHMHADHHGGLAQVIKTSMHLQRSRPLTIVAPGEGIAPLQAYLAASYLIDPFLKYELNWIPMDEYVDRPIPLPGEAQLTAVPNTHLGGYRRRLEQLSKQDSYTFESYSAALVIDSKRLVYTGNLRGARGHDELDSFVEPCDLLITELAHTDPAELGRFLAGRDIAHTAIAHFNRKWDPLSDEELLDLIRQGAGEGRIAGHITPTKDGTVITL